MHSLLSVESQYFSEIRNVLPVYDSAQPDQHTIHQLRIVADQFRNSFVPLFGTEFPKGSKISPRKFVQQIWCGAAFSKRRFLGLEKVKPLVLLPLPFLLWLAGGVTLWVATLGATALLTLTAIALYKRLLRQAEVVASEGT